MIEFIALLVLFILTIAFLGFLYFNTAKQSQKQIQSLMEQVKEDREMLLAGSLQEYQSVKQGKKLPPNEVVDEPNSPEITESSPISMEEITAVQIDDQPKRKVKIYK